MFNRKLLLFAGLVIFCSLIYAQDNGNPRVFITDSKSWEISGGFGGSDGNVGGVTRGGARPQTAEIIKTFNERCPECVVTMKQDKADYVVMLDHEGGKGLVLKDNKFAAFNKDGDAIRSGSTRSLGNSVKEACTAIMENWNRRKTNGSIVLSPQKAKELPASETATESGSKGYADCGKSLKMVPVSSSTTGLKNLSCGEEVTVLSQNGNWTRIRTKEGKEGSVPSRFISEKKQ